MARRMPRQPQEMSPAMMVAGLLLMAVIGYVLVTGSIPGVGSVSNVSDGVGTVMDAALSPFDQLGSVTDSLTEATGSSAGTVIGTMSEAASRIISMLKRIPQVLQQSFDTAVSSLRQSILTIGESIDTALKDWNRSVNSDSGSGDGTSGDTSGDDTTSGTDSTQ